MLRYRILGVLWGWSYRGYLYGALWWTYGGTSLYCHEPVLYAFGRSCGCERERGGSAHALTSRQSLSNEGNNKVEPCEGIDTYKRRVMR